MKQEQKYSIPKLEKCRSRSINQDGLGPGRKIKNKRSFEKLKIDGVKIAYLSLNQELRNCNKNQQCNDWNGWIRLLAKPIYKTQKSSTQVYSYEISCCHNNDTCYIQRIYRHKAVYGIAQKYNLVQRFPHFLPSPQRVGTNFERYLSEVSTRYH